MRDLIDVKCPHCSEGIPIDGRKEFIFCMYCGRKITVPEVLPRKAPVTEADEHTSNGISALKDAKFAAAEEYADKALGVDASNGLAWFIKGCAEICTFDKLTDALESFDKASSLMNPDDRRTQVYRFLNYVTRWGSAVRTTEDPVTLLEYDDMGIRSRIMSTIYRYISKMDENDVCLSYRNCAQFLTESSDGAESERALELLLMVLHMLEHSLTFDDDIKSVHETFSKLHAVAKEITANVSLRKTVAYFFVNRVDLYGSVRDILRMMLSSYSEDDRTSAARYWRGEKEKRADVLGTFGRQMMEYQRACGKMIGGQAGKGKALNAIEKAYNEIAYPGKD